MVHISVPRLLLGKQALICVFVLVIDRFLGKNRPSLSLVGIWTSIELSPAEKWEITGNALNLHRFHIPDVQFPCFELKNPTRVLSFLPEKPAHRSSVSGSSPSSLVSSGPFDSGQFCWISDRKTPILFICHGFFHSHPHLSPEFSSLSSIVIFFLFMDPAFSIPLFFSLICLQMFAFSLDFGDCLLAVILILSFSPPLVVGSTRKKFFPFSGDFSENFLILIFCSLQLS